MTSVFLDTNIILRFLLQDYPPHLKPVNNLFKKINRGKITGIVTAVIIAELYWTLTGPSLKANRVHVCHNLIQLLLNPHIKCEHKDAIVNSLKILQLKNLDFADVYTYMRAKQIKKQVASFDADFDYLDKDIRYQP